MITEVIFEKSRALCPAFLYPRMHLKQSSDTGVVHILNNPRSRKTGGMNQEIMNHTKHHSSTQYSPRPASRQLQTALTPSDRFDSALATSPDNASHTCISASDSAPLSSFDPPHTSASLQGGFHSLIRRKANGPVVATQQISQS